MRTTRLRRTMGIRKLFGIGRQCTPQALARHRDRQVSRLIVVARGLRICFFGDTIGRESCGVGVVIDGA
jgi:hypothetical protein